MRSATFSPTGPAPITTTSYVVAISLPLRGAAEADRRDQEEDAAQYGVPADVGQYRVVRGGACDEGRAGQHREAAAQDHRPLTAHGPAAEGDDQLDEPGQDGPGSPDPQDRRY